jgi:hypothetical protein
MPVALGVLMESYLLGPCPRPFQRRGGGPATVKRHFEGAYARLGVSDRAAAVAEAMRQGLVT